MAKNKAPEISGLFDDLPEEAPQEQIAKISFRNWRTHLASIRALDKRIEKLIDEAVKQALTQGRKLTSADIGRVFQRHPELRGALDKTMQQLNADLTATIEQGSTEAWLRANSAADEVVAAMAANNTQLAALLNAGDNKSQNDRALRAFQQREMQGLKLSDRVWKATEGMKLDMERAIEVALAEGVPAQKLSRRVRELLKEPHRLYRRVRDKKTGELKLSQAAQKYHPGTGVYRSSYKNAMRVARTEVNMAYQASDSERWTRSWWVKGIRVSLSNNHTSPDSKGRPAPLVDICDELAGDYPADFRFTGWHPQCRCFATAITCEYADIRDYYRRKRAGEDMTDYTPPGTINEPPEQFKRWMADNSDRLAGAARRGTTPYFIANNAKYTDPNWKPNIKTSDANQQEKIAKQELNRALKAEDDKMDLTKILGVDTDEEQQLVADFLGRELQDLAVGTTTKVPTQGLHSVQNTVFGKIVDKYVKNGNAGDLPYIVQIDGEHYIVDGNHRVVAEIVNGKTAVLARVNVMPSKVTELLRKLKAEDEDAYWDLITGMGDTDSFIEKAKVAIAPKKTPLEIVDEGKGHMKKGNYGAAMKLGAAEQKLGQKVYTHAAVTNVTESQKENIAEVADLLGIRRKKIKPMDFNKADNGMGNIDFGNGVAFTENCPATIAAHEARLRGLNVTALGFNEKEPTMVRIRERFQEIWIDPATGKAPTPKISGIQRYDKKKKWTLTDDEIIEKAESLMQAPGRYHLGINQLNGDGHVIVAERMQDGTLICFDTQQQEFVALKDWQGYQYLEVLKVDGLIFNTSVLSKLVRKI